RGSRARAGPPYDRRADRGAPAGRADGWGSRLRTPGGADAVHEVLERRGGVPQAGEHPQLELARRLRGRTVPRDRVDRPPRPGLGAQLRRERTEQGELVVEGDGVERHVGILTIRAARRGAGAARRGGRSTSEAVEER